jgi:hypothetical protein
MVAGKGRQRDLLPALARSRTASTRLFRSAAGRLPDQIGKAYERVEKGQVRFRAVETM